MTFISSFFALYKGVIPKMLKLGPGMISYFENRISTKIFTIGGAIMFVVYEQVSLWLTNLNV